MGKTPRLPPGCIERNGRYYRRQYIGMVDGVRKYKWHALSRVSEGMPALYRALAELASMPAHQSTAIPARLTAWKLQALPGLSAAEQKEQIRMADEVGHAFGDFRTEQVQAKHILAFLQQWSSKGKLRTAQRYRAMLSKFFKWVIVQGDRADNPVDPVSTKAPKRSKVYMPHDAFLAIREKLMGNHGHKCASGPMMQCYVDLLYLTGQRGNDIYSLRWADIDEQAGIIRFRPSKTADSTGAMVDFRITPAIRDVLDRAKQLMKGKSRVCPFVIHTLGGAKYTAHGLNSAWSDARKRAGYPTPLGYTLKNIRPKHATDAKTAGHSMEQIQNVLAHADTEMTRRYIKQYEPAVGAVELKLPEKGK